MTSGILLAVLIITCGRVNSIASISKCPEFSKCQCFGNQTMFDLYCPSQIDSKVTVKVKPYYSRLYMDVSINCYSNDILDYSLVPRLDIINLQIVIISKCTLPSNKSLLSGFSMMNLQKAFILILDDCNIELKNQLFEGYTNLKELTVHNTYGLGDFKSLSSLKTLRFLNNKLELKLNMFAGLECLEYLLINGSNFETIQQGVFNNLTNLQHLYLHHNKIKYLTKNDFHGLVSMSSLHLENNLIVQIDKDVFKGLVSLQTIFLSNNIIQKLAETLFKDQTILKALYLNNNKLVQLPNNLFSKNVSLETLNLASNEFVNITRHVFQNLSKLTHLNLENNNINCIHENAFESTRAIEVINLKNNKLFINGYNPFKHLSKLKKLFLQHNSITEMYADWPHEHQLLTDLDISYNKLTVIHPGDLYFFHKEITLNLENNQIMLVDFKDLDLDLDWIKATDKNPTLKVHLKLANNPLMCTDMMLDFVRYLEAFSLNQMKLAYHINVDGIICPPNRPFASLPFPYVIESGLFTSSNSISDCPSLGKCLKRPTDKRLIVECVNIKLEKVPMLPNTKDFVAFELHIQDNQITQLPTQAERPGYANITELYAHNNRISSLHPDNIPTNLAVLAISNNQLTSMSIDVLQRFTSMKKMYLSNNPWTCTCEIFDLITFAVNRKALVRDFQNADCSEDEKKLLALSRADLCPINSDFNIELAVGLIVLLLLFITVASILCCKYDQEIKVWMFAHNLFLGCISENELDKDKKYDAFISYSHKDEEIACQLLTTLESGPNPYKLCIHDRNWVPGEWIHTQITQSVEDSRRTIIVLSPDFLESVWGQTEFRTAHKKAMLENRDRLIVVIFGEIGDSDCLEPDLKAYLKTNTYVKWGDTWFWEKLRYAMSRPLQHINKKQTKENLKLSNNINLALNSKSQSLVSVSLQNV